MNCIILIPAYNAEKTILHLIDQIKNISKIPILIIDDGSKIPVGNILQNNQVLIHRIERNRGKGFALRSGLSLAQKLDYTHAISLDSDLQHPVKHIPAFLAVDEKIDVVIGKRHFGKEMPIHRRLSNFLTSHILSVLCTVKFSDSQCGYRRYRLKSLSGFTFHEDGFIFESEVLLKMFRKKQYRLEEIHIDTVYHNGISHIQNINDTLKFIRLIIRSIIR